MITAPLSRNFVAPLFLLGAVACSDVPEAPAATVQEPQAAAPTSPAAPAAPAATRESLALDAASSKVEFVGAKVTRQHAGGFREFTGAIALAPADVTQSQITVRVVTASLFSDDPQLTEHLKSPDFFDVAQFPEATFTSTSITTGGTGGTHTITGDLTMHGRTKRVTFPATINVEPGRVSATTEFTIDRRDFGIVYPGMANDLIRDNVVLRLALVANRAR
jgi:polyisoprenoid-binding protein YceI